MTTRSAAAMPDAHSDEEPMVRIPRSAAPVPTQPRLRSARLPVAVYIATVAFLVPALIVGSIQLGWFRTNGRVEASTGEAITLDADSSSADIRGWMTLGQLFDAYGITRAEFEAAFPLPADATLDDKLGETAEAAGFDVPAIRAWVDAR